MQTQIGMKLNWAKWFYDLVNMELRHIGTAGMVWGGLSIKHRNDLNKEVWFDLLIALLCGAVLPTLFMFMQGGLPKDEDSIYAARQKPDDNQSSQPPKP